MRLELLKTNEIPRLSGQQLDEEVARYREAIARGALCERCLEANPAGSRFCKDCGRPL